MPASRSRNSRRRVDEDQRQLQPLEPLPNLRRLVEPQHAVVDEDAGQLIADRAVKDERRDGRIDAAAQRADHAPAADLRANLRRRLFDKRRHRPVAGAAADAVGEVAQDLEAAFGVHDLGMKQQRVQPRGPESAIAATGAFALVATTAKPAGAAATKSPWLAQTRISGGTSANSAAGSAAPPGARPAWTRLRRDRRVAELALRRRRHRAAERVRHQLHAVADAEHRACRGRTAPDRSSARPASDTLLGPPDRMMPAGAARADRLGRRVRRPDLRVDRQLAQTTRDELGVLGPEIENDDGLMGSLKAGEGLRRYYSGVGTRWTTRCCSALALTVACSGSIVAGCCERKLAAQARRSHRQPNRRRSRRIQLRCAGRSR